MTHKYTATFSTGETFTRNSEHGYITACAWVNQETGQIRNVSFSAKLNPSPTNMGVLFVSGRWMSNKQRVQGEQRNIETRKVWKVEVVKVN
jgi:hypothetical protein